LKGLEFFRPLFFCPIHLKVGTMTDLDRITQVHKLLDSGRAIDAARMLSEMVQAGDVHALYELAVWAVAGGIIPRDLALAHTLLGRAKDGGHSEAAHLYAYFTAAGTGCAPDWSAAYNVIEQLTKTSDVAQRQIDLLAQMELAENGEPAKTYELSPRSSQPKIATCRQLLTSAECNYVAGAGAPFLAPSTVVDPQTRRLIPHPVRKSQGAMFGVYDEDLVINAINRRIAAISGTAYDQGEPLQLLQYGPGDEYRPHLDALPNERNQRIITVIVYLSDGYSGGETRFVRTDFSFSGKKGDAIIFSNILSDDQPDPMSLHCGNPVENGTKTIATRWIRRARFTYPPPKSMLDKMPGFPV
jgi:prolyl 4-hydroxylase